MYQWRERRKLDEIARRLSSSDPEFARMMTSSGNAPRAVTWMSAWRALGMTFAVLAVLCAILGAGSGFLLSSVLAGALLTYVWWRKRGAHDRGSSESSAGSGNL